MLLISIISSSNIPLSNIPLPNLWSITKDQPQLLAKSTKSPRNWDLYYLGHDKFVFKNKKIFSAH